VCKDGGSLHSRTGMAARKQGCLYSQQQNSNNCPCSCWQPDHSGGLPPGNTIALGFGSPPEGGATLVPRPHPCMDGRGSKTGCGYTEQVGRMACVQGWRVLVQQNRHGSEKAGLSVQTGCGYTEQVGRMACVQGWRVLVQRNRHGSEKAGLSVQPAAEQQACSCRKLLLVFGSLEVFLPWAWKAHGSHEVLSSTGKCEPLYISTLSDAKTGDKWDRRVCTTVRKPRGRRRGRRKRSPQRDLQEIKGQHCSTSTSQRWQLFNSCCVSPSDTAGSSSWALGMLSTGWQICQRLPRKWGALYRPVLQGHTQCAGCRQPICTTEYNLIGGSGTAHCLVHSTY